MSELDVVIMGEALVDFLPTTRGRIRDVRAFEVHSGGAPCNVAVGVARLGGKVGFVGVVGEDEFGHLLRNALERDGVDAGGLRHTSEAKTGLSFIALDEHGERTFLFYRRPSADMLLAERDADPAYLGRAGILHFGTNSLLLPAGVAAARALVAHGRARGAVISCDPNLRLHLWDDPEVLRALLGELTAACEVVKCSAEEAPFVTGADEPHEAAAALVARGAKLAVVTRGAGGAVWARAGDRGEAPAQAVEVVDATGAGDGFMAALLVRLSAELRGGVRPGAIPADRLTEHVRFACRVGSRVCTRLGAATALARLGDELPT